MAIVCSTARCPRGQCRRIGVWSGGGGAPSGNSPGSSSSATSPASSPSPSSTGTLCTLELVSMMNMPYIINIFTGIVVPWNSSKSLKNSYCGAGNFKNLKKGSLMSLNIVFDNIVKNLSIISTLHGIILSTGSRVRGFPSPSCSASTCTSSPGGGGSR